MSQAELEDKVHFYYCALLALKFAEKYQAVRSPTAQRVFLMRWLAKASSKRLFPPGGATGDPLVTENNASWRAVVRY